MGLQLGPLVKPIEVPLESLKGKKLSLDAYNMLYQFLATIRQADGRPFTGSDGEVTGHLVGLLYRTTSLLVNGIRPVYVFDGKPSALKASTLKGRAMAKARAAEQWAEALKAGDLEEAKRKAAATSRITERMVTDAKTLLDAMGVPWVQAPSEGEAQAAMMALKGDVWAAASEDYDTLLFGTPRLIRGLAALKTMGRDQGSVRLLKADELLSDLGISRDELILMGILMGTDFNEGFPGIGPKKALKLALKHHGYGSTIQEVGGDPEALDEVRELFSHPPFSEDYNLEWKRPSGEEILHLLVETHRFDELRIARVVERLKESPAVPDPGGMQRSLEDFGGGR